VDVNGPVSCPVAGFGFSSATTVSTLLSLVVIGDAVSGTGAV
jgi:hypothetical protein